MMEGQKITKSVYFVEETQNIEGAYVEVNTLFVADNPEQATEFYEKLVKEKPKKSFGLLLNEYIINAEGGFSTIFWNRGKIYQLIFTEKCRS